MADKIPSDELIESWGMLSFCGAVMVAVVGICNLAIGTVVDSPNGSFQDHLNDFLLILMLPLIGSVALALLVRIISSVFRGHQAR